MPFDFPSRFSIPHVRNQETMERKYLLLPVVVFCDTIVLSFDQIWIQDVFPHSLIVWSFCKAPFQGVAGTNPTQKSMLSWLGFVDINIIIDRFQNRRKLMLIKNDLVMCTLQVSFATPSPWCRHVVYQQAKKLIPFALWLTIRGRT